MPYESQFSWRKILSFFGVALLVLGGIVGLSQGIGLITSSKIAGGIFSILGGLIAFAGAYFLYRNYNKYSKEHNNDKPNYTR